MQYYFLVSFVDEIFDRKWKMEDVRGERLAISGER